MFVVVVYEEGDTWDTADRLAEGLLDLDMFDLGDDVPVYVRSAEENGD